MAVICDANKLPEEIKAKAKDYCTNRLEHSYADTREELEEDVMCAWLNGFASCIEGIVEVKAKQCATCVYADSPCTLSDYAKDDKGVCSHYKNVIVENAELKQKLNALEGQTPWKDIKDKSEVIGKLTKAKEIIQSFLRWHTGEDRGSSRSSDLVEQAEQFLKECEE
jgi:hypothetical protein